MVYTLYGGSALSEFRQKRTTVELRKALQGCEDARAFHFYLVSMDGFPDQAQADKIRMLLGISEHCEINPTFSSNRFPYVRKLLVVPRLGTISPWSTKATDIFNLCGLDSVKRIERGVLWEIAGDIENTKISDYKPFRNIVFDPMTQSILGSEAEAESLFTQASPASLDTIDVNGQGKEALLRANIEFGFALNNLEQDYLVHKFREMGRNPTDAELMMFAQINSEHCRHKIFNARWNIDGEDKECTLFSMIRHTHASNPVGTLSAYSDNAAVIEGAAMQRFAPDSYNHNYGYTKELLHTAIKVETHNHPVAISPYPGAATGSGGEIRDEGATGRGGKPRAGLVGYSVSQLRLPGLPRPWEIKENRPDRIASPLQIMIEAPVGAAAFNNEFGRPCIAGFFRDFEWESSLPELRYGYHKPIMLAGGVGSIRHNLVEKKTIPDQTPIVVLGGPGMLIGLGGGSASSAVAGSRCEELDFVSVQRGNAEMQRRCQEVIDACCELGDQNPILSIHDVGAGGLCNALPELIHNSDCGGSFQLRAILNDEPSMSPMQVWCNESQERYVLAVENDHMDIFQRLCERERCLYTVVGKATSENRLELTDSLFEDAQKPVDLPMDILFDFAPAMCRQVVSMPPQLLPLRLKDINLEDALDRVLSHPTVGDKTFLVTIADRSVTGLIVRDQMIGPWQVPVADVGIIASGYRNNTGQAMGVGERTPVAVIDAPASGRMAVGEAITNLAAANIGNIGNIKLSANWMVAAGEPGHDAALYETVRSIALEICPALNISIPVGKDSMSMHTVWQDDRGNNQKVVAPLSLIISGFAQVQDIRRTLTPELVHLDQDSVLLLIDLGQGKNRLGGSILAQVYGQLGDQAADLDNPDIFLQFFHFIQTLIEAQLALAYHDRSDGGLITTLCEMMFATRCGISVKIPEANTEIYKFLFNEELGAVIQVRRAQFARIMGIAESFGLDSLILEIGQINEKSCLEIRQGDRVHYTGSRQACHQAWSSTTWQIQRMRDNPVCADQEYLRITDQQDRGLFCDLSFKHNTEISRQIFEGPRLNLSQPRIAILREQGVNGHLEMAAAFDSVGFTAVDVTTTDLLAGLTFDGFHGLAACGGFSFGDVLGAGAGWGKSILYNNVLKDKFEEFFNHSDTFALGVCNGCQMFSCIKTIIPGASHWPDFVRNYSEQYEARLVMTEICSDKSMLFTDMKGSMIPISTAHGEGRALFRHNSDLKLLNNADQICLRYVDNCGRPTDRYPMNPNGSFEGVTGFTNSDGRFTIMMPHPERVYRTVSNSWHLGNWGEYSPWIKLFQNARNWVG